MISTARVLCCVFLCSLGVSFGGAAAEEAASPNGFVLARLQYGGGGDWYSGSAANLLTALRERTNVAIARSDEAHVALSDPDLFNYPFLYMNGHGNVRFGDDEVERLRQFLLAGGFLFANDDYGMDRSFRREMARVFPDRSLVEVPFDHPIYHCFYDFPSGLPKIHEHDDKEPLGLGIFDRGRLVVFYAYETDIGDGLEDENVHRDPPEKREQALRMAINIVLYAMTQ